MPPGDDAARKSAERVAAERAASAPPNPAKLPSETVVDASADRDRHRSAATERTHQEVAALTPDDDPTKNSVKDGKLQIRLEHANGQVVDVPADARPFRVIVGGTSYVQSAIEPNDKGDKVWVYRSDLDAKR